MATNISGSGDSTFGGTIQSTGVDVTGTVAATTFTGDGSALTGISTTSDKIEEGNSSVEVVDAGTGYVAVTVDGTEVSRFADGGDFRFNSGYGSVATAYGCRAWVNFNGTGTVAIRASGNVSSITDNGTGDYTVNFTTAMPDGNYSVATSSSHPERPLRTGISASSASGITTSSVRLQQYYGTGGAALGQDVAFVGVAIFR